MKHFISSGFIVMFAAITPASISAMELVINDQVIEGQGHDGDEKQQDIAVDIPPDELVISGELCNTDTLRALYKATMQKLTSPKGAVTIGSLYALSQGVSNFLWAFDWQLHAGTSAETKATIQEVGGISAAAECIIGGVLLPILFYEYSKRNAEKMLAEEKKL